MKKILFTFAVLSSAILLSQATPAFNITNLSSSYSITCANPAVNLIATSSYTASTLTYSWTNGVTIISGTNVLISNPGVYTVTAYTSATLSGSQTISIGSNMSVPSSTLAPTLQNITCNPSSPMSHSATSSYTATHLWISPMGGTVLASSSFTSVYAPGAVGTYTHIAMDPVSGCFVSKTFTVASASTLPSFILVSSPANFTMGCTNSVLTVSLTNGQGSTPGSPVSYTLLAPGSSTSLPGPLSAAFVYTIGTAGTWTAVARDVTTNCEMRSAFSVIQNTVSPVISVVASSSSVCAGDVVVLTASGANTFTFTGGVTNGVGFIPTGTTSYSVTGTNTINGCSSSIPVVKTITVIPAPGLSITPSSPSVCAGGTISLTGSGAHTYSWSGGVINGQPFSPLGSTTYSLTGTNTLTGCSGSSTITIGVNPPPIVSAIVTSPSVCLGGTVMVSGTGATTYSWSNSILNNTPFSPTITATYTVTGTDAAGCSNTSTTTIIVEPGLPITVTASDPIFCAGMATTLTASGANTYTWSNTQQGNTIIVSPNSTTVYSVAGTGTGTCLQNGNYTLNVNTSSSFNYTVSGMTVSLTLSGSGCSSFLWDFGNSVTNTLNPNPVVTYTQAGIYGICFKCDALPNACVRCFNISVPGNSSGGVGIEEVEYKTGLQLYPNPNDGEFTVEASVENSTLIIFNYLGEKISEKLLNLNKNFIKLDSSKGIYYYKVISVENQTHSGKLIVK